MLDKRLVKDNFADRQGKHNRALRRKEKDPNASYIFVILEKNITSKGELNKLEEDWIRAGDGPERKGGTLENYRYQMDEESYKNAGGCMAKK